MSDFELSEDEKGQLLFRESASDSATVVVLRRAFPWTNPTKHVAVRTREGEELRMIADLSSLQTASRQVAERWLARNTFIPKITRVHRISQDFGYQEWVVDTDRGPASFRVQEREDIRFLHDGRFAVKDADGNVYELMRISELDAASRKVVEGLL